MFKQDILDSKGNVYATVKFDGNQLSFSNFRAHNLSFVMDARVVEQLLPILQSIKLIQWTGAVNK